MKFKIILIFANNLLEDLLKLIIASDLFSFVFGL